MTLFEITMAVGTDAAARLMVFKSKLGDTADERAAEVLPASTVIDGLRQMLADRLDTLGKEE